MGTVFGPSVVGSIVAVIICSPCVMYVSTFSRFDNQQDYQEWLKKVRQDFRQEQEFVETPAEDRFLFKYTPPWWGLLKFDLKKKGSGWNPDENFGRPTWGPHKFPGYYSFAVINPQFIPPNATTTTTTTTTTPAPTTSTAKTVKVIVKYRKLPTTASPPPEEDECICHSKDHDYDDPVDCSCSYSDDHHSSYHHQTKTTTRKPQPKKRKRRRRPSRKVRSRIESRPEYSYPFAPYFIPPYY